MAEHPILFSAPMVRAILAGTKTQTRRVIKPQRNLAPEIDSASGIAEFYNADECVGFIRCPYGKPSDRLWVRETWAHVPVSAYRCSAGVLQTEDPTSGDMAAVYAAGWERSVPGRWRPSIHMPRWASRITLEITDVRVQRVQDISEADALAEGCRSQIRHSAAFADLWESINAKRGFGWNANPWVWALTFKRAEA